MDIEKNNFELLRGMSEAWNEAPPEAAWTRLEQAMVAGVPPAAQAGAGSSSSAGTAATGASAASGGISAAWITGGIVAAVVASASLIYYINSAPESPSPSTPLPDAPKETAQPAVQDSGADYTYNQPDDQPVNTPPSVSHQPRTSGAPGSGNPVVTAPVTSPPVTIAPDPVKPDTSSATQTIPATTPPAVTPPVTNPPAGMVNEFIWLTGRWQASKSEYFEWTSSGKLKVSGQMFQVVKSDTTPQYSITITRAAAGVTLVYTDASGNATDFVLKENAGASDVFEAVSSDKYSQLTISQTNTGAFVLQLQAKNGSTALKQIWKR